MKKAYKSAHKRVGEVHGVLRIVGVLPIEKRATHHIYCDRYVQVKCLFCASEKNVILKRLLNGERVSCGCLQTISRFRRAEIVATIRRVALAEARAAAEVYA